MRGRYVRYEQYSNISYILIHIAQYIYHRIWYMGLGKTQLFPVIGILILKILSVKRRRALEKLVIESTIPSRHLKWENEENFFVMCFKAFYFRPQSPTYVHFSTLRTQVGDCNTEPMTPTTLSPRLDHYTTTSHKSDMLLGVEYISQIR